ncbi:MAG: AMP-binding protein [Kiritimatiellae bacterium]|nr:AMP-binding protein [Kiritimatiellia bacterium]
MATIRCPLNEATHISMNEAAVVSADGALLFSETEQCVVATAELLTGKGVKTGDRVGLLVRAGWEEVILFWALLRIGAVACPLGGWVEDGRLEQAVREIGIGRLVRDGSQASPEGVPTLEVKDLTGFTGRFKKAYRPVLEIERAAVVLPCGGGAEGRSFCTHSVGSLYYAALAGNGVLPLRSSVKHHWALEPLWSFQGVDTLFRCAVAGASVVVGLKHPPSLEEINRLEVTHCTVAADGVEALRGQLDGAETELTHVLVDGPVARAQAEALRASGLYVVSVLGQAETGFYAVLDREGRVHPMRRSQVKVDGSGALLVSGKTLAREVAGDWFDTGVRCRTDEDGRFFLSE